MTILSAPDIRAEHKQGNIIIDPFNDEQVNPNSYDVCLGGHYVRVVRPVVMRHSQESDLSVLVPANWINIQSQTHLDERLEVFDAPTVKQLKGEYPNDDYSGLGDSDSAIVIEPMESVLCPTKEFIGGANYNITTLMKAKSTMNRNFMTVCHDAGWGDIGFHNRWTMRITNGNHQRVLLKVGMRVAQIAFFYVSKPVGVGDEYAGSYQDREVKFDQLKRNWEPKHMLPKVKKS